MSFEQLVEELNSVQSAWGLADKVPALKEGLSDLLHRVRVLEAEVKALKKK